MEDKIPQDAIDSIAKHINERTNKSYSIPTVGNESNPETPQIFEIVSFGEIDKSTWKVYAIDGSINSQSFYNGVSVGLYRGGYVCFQSGKQLRMNDTTDPVILGKAYTPKNILVIADEHLEAIYDELLELEPVNNFIRFLGGKTDEIFSHKKPEICQTLSNLLAFCQEVLEWSLVYEVANRSEVEAGDFILLDGDLRSVQIKQEFLVKLGKFLHEKNIYLIGITKNSPIKMELSYTLRQIDSYLQDKLKPKYPFNEKDPRRQKLCCWFEVSGPVLSSAYSGTMFPRKALTGGRGVGLFFVARLDYVEKLQNYDWVVADINIFDAIPGIEQGIQTRDVKKLKYIFYELGRLTQEHYILGYPYPLVETHNFVTLKSDFKEEVINRVKQSMYANQHMDHVDIENMFLDIHSRF
ncbi:MAG: hypothetical protein ACREKN_03265 [Longimicrobiaceae bacterium]